MSKQARIKKASSLAPPSRSRRQPHRPTASTQHRPTFRTCAIAAVSVVVVSLLVVVALGQSKPSAPPTARVNSGLAPAFSAKDVLTGQPITSAGLRGKNVLLFFSEGVMCQACFEQIQSLEQSATQLRNRGLTLVSITTDPPDVLRQAVQQYGIKTPMISDANGTMSSAYGAIGQGMHANTDGHTFLLLDTSGHIRWRQDYTTMYVPPKQLFAAIPKVN